MLARDLKNIAQSKASPPQRTPDRRQQNGPNGGMNARQKFWSRVERDMKIAQRKQKNERQPG